MMKQLNFINPQPNDTIGMSRTRGRNRKAAKTKTRRVAMNRSQPLHPLPLLWMTAAVLLLRIPNNGVGLVTAVPPPPQANDIFGTVNGCASALVEMDDNQDGIIKRGEYLDFVNLLADFLCIPRRPILDLEIQTVFYSISCLCQEREGFGPECCFGSDAGIFTKGAADAITRTEDEDSYLRAACLLTQSILGPQQCSLDPRTLSPGAISVAVDRLRAVAGSEDGLSDTALGFIIAGALLLALLCCVLLFCACIKREEEEEEEIIIKEEIIIENAKVVEEPDAMPAPGPLYNDEEAPSIPPPQHTSREPKNLAPVAMGGAILRSVPAADDESVEEKENTGRKSGATMDDDEEEDYGRRFGGQGMLPLPPAPEGVRLRHVERESDSEEEIIYPEREFHEEKFKREDSGQILPHEEIDSGVNIPTRPVAPAVVFNHPKYQRPVKKEPEPYDPRKMRKQLGYGDGEVWAALAVHEEQRKPTRENRFEWIVQGALDVLARANESGELTKPRPARSGSPQRMRPSPTPPARAKKGEAYNDVMEC